MKFASIILCFIFCVRAFGQSSEDTVQVIAKFISKEPGDKIHFYNFLVIKVLKGGYVSPNIKVGYYFYNEYGQMPDTVLLNLSTYKANPELRNYFIMRDYDAKKNIETVQISTVSFNHWENCETGKACPALFFQRDPEKQHWFLLTPCGGSFTDASLYVSGKKEPLQELSMAYADCPPVFDLSRLPDGRYTVDMKACSLGGRIEFSLITTNK